MLIGGVAALALTLITPGERLFGASPTSPANAVDFDRQVRPILSDNCFTCHGPDDSQRQAKLRLDTKDGMFADRGGYQVIVPGDPANSRLFQRISHKEEIARMPPPGSERKLTPQQIETIGKWIEQGAAWETHWAYIPPKRPELPAVNRSTASRGRATRSTISCWRGSRRKGFTLRRKPTSAR